MEVFRSVVVDRRLFLLRTYGMASRSDLVLMKECTWGTLNTVKISRYSKTTNDEVHPGFA